MLNFFNNIITHPFLNSMYIGKVYYRKYQKIYKLKKAGVYFPASFIILLKVLEAFDPTVKELMASIKSLVSLFLI